VKKISMAALTGLITALLVVPQLGSSQTVVARTGTQIRTEIAQTISSKVNHNNDTFQLVVKDGFFFKNPEALKGAVVDGHVEGVTPAAATHKATMNVIFDDIALANGTKIVIHALPTSIKTFEPKTHHLRDAGLIVGAAVAGHMVSSKTGHKGGTLAGAAGGFALANSLKSDIVVKKGTEVKLKLTQDLVPMAAVSN